MRISLHDFRGADDVERCVETEELWSVLFYQGQAIGFPQGVFIKVLLAGDEDVVRVSGMVSTVLRLSCSRCTQEFDYPVNVDVSDQIPLDRDDDPEEQWGSSYLDSERDELDLSEYALILILEQLPLQPLCRQDCRGLCSSCGQNLNQGQCDCSDDGIDPRLAVLRQLLPDGRK